MVNYYLADGWMKFYEEDVYQDGCLPHTGGIIDGREQFKAETLNGLINEILSFTDGDREGMELDACDDIGRVDISLMENADGARATKSEIECWKDGDLQLWDCIYTFRIQRVQSETLNLHEELGL
jgi:hypothetical protein